MKTNKLLQLLKDNARAEAAPAIRCEVSDTQADIYVYDVIDSMWGASASGLVSALASAGDKTVHMHINSPGGDVFEARAMTAAIAAHPGTVIAHIDGVAASAASYLALAASEVRMTDGGLFMIHNAWTMAMGNASDFRSTADLLQKIDGTIAADYMRKTGKSADDIAALMDAETWMTAQEALDAGFIDAIDANTQAEGKAAAKWNLAAYANAPAAPEPQPDLVALAAAQTQHNRNRLRLFQI